jgi:hypothetical protein
LTSEPSCVCFAADAPEAARPDQAAQADPRMTDEERRDFARSLFEQIKPKTQPKD